MSERPSLKIKVQLFCGEEIALGPGKADLLEAIAATGSISAAARRLKMSYRRAWLLVDVMNRCWKEPLVITAPEGARSGARLSVAGLGVLAHYRALMERVESGASGDDWRALSEAILPEPRLTRNAG